MAKRLPPEAIELYWSLGPSRSYAAVADHFGVSKRAVTKRAAKENWQRRIEEREQKTRAAVESRVEETVIELRARHAKILKAMTAKALEALKLPMTSAMDGVRALDLVIKAERLLHEQPTEHTAIEAKVAVVGPPPPSDADMLGYLSKLFEHARDAGLIEMSKLQELLQPEKKPSVPEIPTPQSPAKWWN